MLLKLFLYWYSTLRSRVFKTLHQGCLTLLIKGVKHLQPRVFNTFETRYSIFYLNRLTAVVKVSPFRGRRL